jgi:di/tricarboxylate transporter
LLVLLFIVVTNAVGLFSLYFASSIGILVLVITGIMNWSEVHTTRNCLSLNAHSVYLCAACCCSMFSQVIDAIPGNLLLMIAFSFSLSAAMTNSGIAKLLGDSFAIAFRSSYYIQLFGVYLATK